MQDLNATCMINYVRNFYFTTQTQNVKMDIQVRQTQHQFDIFNEVQ
jgi:hypothetical protein